MTAERAERVESFERLEGLRAPERENESKRSVVVHTAFERATESAAIAERTARQYASH